MQYVDYGKTGLKVSRFGLGCMRFPKTDGPEGTKIIDQEKAAAIMHRAIELGVNYFDTAYVYQGSEVAVGLALEGGLREKVYIAAKCPVWFAKKRNDLMKLLDEELARLRSDYIDIYLFHSMNRDRWEALKSLGGLEFANEAKAMGKIKHCGFSFHGPYDLFEEIVDAFDWDMCQIQLNYLDEKHQAGLAGMEYAAKRGIPVVAMEPLRGGALANNVPTKVQNMFDQFKVQRSPVEWAMRWLYNKPEVTTILSGVSTLEQLEEDIEIFDKAETDCMDDAENELIDYVKVAYKENQNIGCTRCGYCMPCPHGVNIPEVFELYNGLAMEGYENHCRFQYTKFIHLLGNGSEACTQCGNCEPLCPQEIPIIDGLKDAHQELLNKALL